VQVAVIVDVDPVDRVRVEFRAGHERVHVDDQHRRAGVAGRLEDEQVGEVQARVVAGVLEIGGAEVVRHLWLLWW